MNSRVTIDPETTSWIEVYRRMTEIVIPRPIALVSTVDAQGRPNLAPFSFYTVVSSNPPHIAFAPHLSGRTGQKKDTLRNIEATGEFVIASATERLTEQVNACAALLPPEDSEFAHSGLTPEPAETVTPFLVKESPINLECKLVEIRVYGDQGGAGHLVVGKITRIHLDPTILNEEGQIRSETLQAVGRMGTDLWVKTRETFPMPRPE